MFFIHAPVARRVLASAALILGSTACVGNPPPGETAIWVSYAPPSAPHEHRPRRPDRLSIWIEGYYQWNSTAYVWVPGHWERRPHPKARWHGGHWYRGNRGWYWVEGRWEHPGQGRQDRD